MGRDRLPRKRHGKEGRRFESVRGLCKSRANRGFCCPRNLQKLHYALGMEPLIGAFESRTWCLKAPSSVGNLAHAPLEPTQGGTRPCIPAEDVDVMACSRSRTQADQEARPFPIRLAARPEMALPRTSSFRLHLHSRISAVGLELFSELPNRKRVAKSCVSDGRARHYLDGNDPLGDVAQ